ncbi:MAG: histone-like nucleoid-structuring protein Lsr2 [Gaiellales bacterium]
MAKTTIVQITDDLDDSKNAQEVSFSFQGVDYTIDLGKKNLSAFEKALMPYIDAATKVSKGSSRKRSSRSGSARPNLAAVREWAKSAGIKVSDRGRIPTSVMEQYAAAQRG